jgi:hypothetical protein
VRIGRLVLAAVGAGALTAACAGSGYQYVENEDQGVFAKVPGDWAVYDTEALLAAMHPDRPLTGAALEQQLTRVWMRGFDASAEPSAEGTMKLGGPEPRGFVQVQALAPAQRDQINLSGLRSAVLGTDPMASVEQQAAAGGAPPENVQVLVDEPSEFDGGYHGTHNVYAVQQSAGVAIVDQTALLDSTSSKLYLFVVSCDENCYFRTRSDEIAQIVDSWTIEDTRA